MQAEFAKTVIFDAYRAVWANAFSLLRAMWLPVILGGLSLYLALDLYFRLLQQFLAAPTPRAQSLALAVGVGGMLLWFLFHSVAAMTAIRSGHDHPRRTWVRLRIRRAELRMFAGILRFLGILVAWATFLVGAWYIADKCIGPSAILISASAFFIGAVILWARMVFLMPAVVAVERVRILRRSWHLTRGLLLPLLAVWLLVTMPPLFLMEAVGDILLKTGVFGGPLQAGISPDLDPVSIVSIRTMLPGWVLTFTISTALSLALTVMASLSAYRLIADQQGRG